VRIPLGEQAALDSIDGVSGQSQLAGDVFVRIAAGDQIENVALTPAQAMGIGAGSWDKKSHVRQLLLHFRGKECAANFGLVGYQTVQEHALSTNATFTILLYCDGSYAPVPEIRMRFTELSVLPNGGACYHVEESSVAPMLLNLRDCEFCSGNLQACASTGMTPNMTNCLFRRVGSYFQVDNARCYNNTFFGGITDFFDLAGQNYTLRDNLFDQTSLWNGSSGSWTLDHNGYAGYFRLYPTNATDVILPSSPIYQTAALGDFYLPSGSTLTNAGSRLASVAGLFHYTTQTNQNLDTLTVDIGYHYVAVNANG
jgi:hypothetical protein